MVDLGRWDARITARHVGMPPHDTIRMTVEAQASGGALFVRCDFSRQDWKQLIEQLSNTLTTSPRFHPDDIPAGLAAVAQTVASWPADDEPAYRQTEPRAKYSQDNVEVQLADGLLIFSLWRWLQIIVEMHPVWSDSPDAWESWQPIRCP